MNLSGKLTWDAIPWDEPLPLVAGGGAFATLAIVLIFLGVKGYLPYIWKNWITSVDHKKVGIMYCMIALLMLTRGFVDAIMMRTQQALATSGGDGFLPADHYDQVFSAHGTIMIFFVAMTFIIGLMNFAVPLQLGVRDVAFPVLNSVSFWLTCSAVLLINLSLFIGDFAATGWLVFPPLSEKAFSPTVGVDYYLVGIQISGVGTLLAAINIVVTIVKMRAPGMKLYQMPMFCWTSLVACLLMIAAFPILTGTLGMLMLDRYADFHFFTNDGGGNAMMYFNLIWAWGHPEVYILILPVFGVFSEVVATFSKKPLFAYRSMVTATMVICVLSFVVWLHHFFTMGAGANVNAFFGVMTMVIAVPTGVKIFNWLFTMWGGKITYEPPMLWAVGFIVTFVIGGMTGVMLAVPPADFVFHNSLFLVAHFHNVIIGGVVYGAFAGVNYWFPKAFGYRLHKGLGTLAFLCWLIGFYVTFMPMYWLGILGMTRRLHHTDNPDWAPYLYVALAGVGIILIGLAATVMQILFSVATNHEPIRETIEKIIRPKIKGFKLLERFLFGFLLSKRQSPKDKTGDTWGSQTLEWSTSSPPPHYNYARLPCICSENTYYDLKDTALKQAQNRDEPPYKNIEMPANSSVGFFTALFASICGFGMIWHIWWMVIGGLVAVFAIFIRKDWLGDIEHEISAEELRECDKNQIERSIA